MIGVGVVGVLLAVGAAVAYSKMGGRPSSNSRGPGGESAAVTRYQK